MEGEKIWNGWLFPILLVLGVILLAGLFQRIPILGSLLALAFAASALALVAKKSWQDAVFTRLQIEGDRKRFAVLIPLFLFMMAVPGASVEEKPTKPVVDAQEQSALLAPKELAEPPPLISYRILNLNIAGNSKVSFDVEIGLVDGELPSEGQLASLSKKLVGSLPYQRKYVGFYLPGMVIDSGYFATAHHLPELEVKINEWSLPDRYKQLLHESE